MNLTDQQIIRRVKGGDTEAFGLLVEKYKDMVFSIALKLVADRDAAEELAHQSFVNAYSRIGSFRSEAAFSSWVYRIVYNGAMDIHRRKKRWVAEDRLEDEGGIFRCPRIKRRATITQKSYCSTQGRRPSTYHVVLLRREKYW